MDKINEIVYKIEMGENIALTRFNDGEMMGIDHVGAIVARGDQTVDQLLNIALKNALKHKQKNYYVGIPCNICYPHWNKTAKEIVGENKYLTKAVVTTNRNYEFFSKRLPELTTDKRVIWVGGKSHSIRKLRKNVGIDVDMHIRLKDEDCWSDFDTIFDSYKLFHKDDMVLLSCGPMAEVLIHRWFKLRPDVTFMDIGSLYDPHTKNRRLNCHTGNVYPCQECN